MKTKLQCEVRLNPTVFKGLYVTITHLPDYILKIWKHFDLLDEILGTRTNIHLPFEHESFNAGADEGVQETEQDPSGNQSIGVGDVTNTNKTEKQEKFRKSKPASDFVIACTKRTEVKLAETDLEQEKL